MSDYLELAKKALADPKVERLEPGSMIHWQAMDGSACGPTPVEHVSRSGGRRWAWVTWEGLERAVSEILITTVEPGASHHE